MRLLKENYEGLQKINNLSEPLKKFLSDPKIQELFRACDFSTLYKKLGTNSPDLTELLNDLNINPLDYLDYIPKYFLAWTGIESIDIPNHIKEINASAFYNCVSLMSITIPDSVTSIGINAFYGCSKLQNIYITDIAEWCNISGLHNLMGYGASSKNLYLNNKLVISITIPNGVMAIPVYTFRNCSGLTSITIPDSVTSISWGPFEGCSNLTSINYIGIKDQWSNINFSDEWNINSSIKTIHCTDGDINL